MTYLLSLIVASFLSLFGVTQGPSPFPGDNATPTYVGAQPDANIGNDDPGPVPNKVR